MKKVEKVVHADKPESPEYEVHLTSGKSGAEVVFAADGKQLRAEENR